MSGSKPTDVVKKLESGGRILSLIRKAETKRVAKRKIIGFLKKKGVSEHKIIEAYQEYYSEEGLYEITFHERPLGFSVIMDTRGKNAIVSSVQDDNNKSLGMKVASRMYEVNGKRVDDLKHKEILKLISACECPFYVVFRETRRKNKRLAKLQKKMESSTWVEVSRTPHTTHPTQLNATYIHRMATTGRKSRTRAATRSIAILQTTTQHTSKCTLNARKSKEATIRTLVLRRVSLK